MHRNTAGLNRIPVPLGKGMNKMLASNHALELGMIQMRNFRVSADATRLEKRLGAANEITDFGEDVPEDALFSNGRTGRTMHNLYPLLYNEAVFDVTREERGQGVVWGRSGTAGSQRYPVCWSGDPAASFDNLYVRGFKTYYQPIPVTPAAWLLRTFGHRLPVLNETGVDELIMALGETTSPDNPLYVEVDDDEQGEKVQVYIG